MNGVTGSVSATAAVRSVVETQNTTATHRQPEVKFGTVVLHRVSVYITWPRETRCGTSDTTDVVGYRLRYQATDDANEFISRQLADNFVFLENVQSNARYRFQVKYLFADGSETDWSEDGLIDTTPVQRQTVTNWTTVHDHSIIDHWNHVCSQSEYFMLSIHLKYELTGPSLHVAVSSCRLRIQFLQASSEIHVN